MTADELTKKINDGYEQAISKATFAAAPGSAKAHTELAHEEGKWTASLGTAEHWSWTKRECEIAHAAFIAGWYRRTGENPDSPNDKLTP